MTKRKRSIILFVTKLTTEKRLPLRQKFETAPCFFLNVSSSLKIIDDYHDKYNAMDIILDKIPDILDAFHEDLKEFGSTSGRQSKFSSEQVLRLALVKGTEASVLRETIIRVSESDFLRNFTRIGIGQVPNFTFLCDALKCIKPSTWETINKLLLKHALKEKLISGDSLRLDSTVCESNIHYPTDAHLMWDGFRVVTRLVRRMVVIDKQFDCGNRFHDRKMKKLFTFVSTQASRKDKSVKRKVDMAMRTMIERLEWLVDVGDRFMANALNAQDEAIIKAYSVICELQEMLPKVAHVAQQSRRAWINGEKVPATDRIFSIFEEHTELLKRGKVRQPIEFGHLVQLAQTKEKFISFYAVEKQSKHDTQYRDEVIRAHIENFGKEPKT